MKQTPSSKPPDKNPAKTGISLAVMVGGFLLLIMVIGWIYLSSRG